MINIFYKNFSDNNAQSHPESISRSFSRLCSCSTSSSLESSILVTNSRTLNSSMKIKPRKIVPAMDEFASRKRTKNTHLDEQLVEAGTAISNAMTTVSALIADKANKENKKRMDICMQ